MLILNYEFLEELYNKYNNEEYDDPVLVCKKLKYENDIELFSFISALFAYGSIKQIKKFLFHLLDIFNYEPYYAIKNFNLLNNEIYYRFQTKNDIEIFLRFLKHITLKYNSIGNYFYKLKVNNLEDYCIELYKLFLNFLESQDNNITHGLKFLFPNISKNTNCKRLFLFFRWMVRKDNIDFGIYNFIKPNQLIYPIDIHLSKIIKNYTDFKFSSPNLRIAKSFTDYMKKINNNDPLKYDFALCHWDMNIKGGENG